MKDMVELNPHFTVESLMSTMDGRKSDECTVQNWELSSTIRHCQLTKLPESFGSLTVRGDLDLNENELRTLPESFGSLTVGRDLTLDQNQLTTLPESFGSLTVGGELNLNGNPFRTLPASFLNVKGDVHRPDTARDRRECIIC